MLRRRKNTARDLRAADYAALSQAARLAAALRTLDQWLSHVGVADPQIDRLIEHLWAYPTITYKTFAGWESSIDDCDVLDMALGYDMPERLIANCRELGISADHLRTAITSTTEIVYSSLYAAVSDELTLKELASLEQLTRQYGLRLPPAELYRSSPFSERHGAGHVMTVEEIEAWRNAAW